MAFRRHSWFTTLLLISILLATIPLQAFQKPENSWIPDTVSKSGFQLSMINEKTFTDWMEFIEPTIEELDWNAIRWHHSLSAAAAEAKRLNRPILLWTMNGHPFEDT